MGSGMTMNLLKERDVTVFNRTKEKAQDVLDAGATWAASAAEAAKEASVLFTMLPHPEAVSEVMLADGGVLDALPKGALWVDCSTVTPSFSRAMAETAKGSGIRFLDAPVSGSRGPAEEGTLTFLVGGEALDVEAARPLLALMGKKILHVGAHGAGSAMKLVFNQFLGINMAAFAEVLHFGEALNLSRDALLDALLGAHITPPFLSNKRAQLESSDSITEFPLRWMHKDLHLIAQTAYETGAYTPLAALSELRFRAAMQDGRAEADVAAIAAPEPESDA